MITKSVDKSSIVVGEGGDTQVRYTVDVTRGTPTPTAWTLSGDITVHNPNTFESITATVTDAVDIPGLTCTVAGSATVTILPGTDARLPYTCTVAAGADPGTLSGTNTATATWDAAEAHTAVGTATGAAGVTGTLTGSVDESITVSDPMAPGGVVGTFGGSGSATYDVTLTGTAGQCQTIDNTATISSTGQSDAASVQLCIVKAPTATKTAAGTFTRTYDWTITKSAGRHPDRDRTRRLRDLHLHGDGHPWDNHRLRLGNVGHGHRDQPQRLPGVGHRHRPALWRSGLMHLP
ncbi:MAG: hypothetical protein V9F04_16280 [Dermatophilaceae bacterium]